jgi:predicted transposase
MKLTIKAKLLTDKQQHESLLETMASFNDACNYISDIAYKNKIFSQVPLHHLAYKDTRIKFPQLASQFIVRAIAVVSDSYVKEKKTLHKFKKHSAVVYDQRILSFKRLSIASINSVSGRLKIPFIIGRYNTLAGRTIKGQADLTLENNKFFLNIVIELPGDIPYTPKGVLGIDKGIVNIATTSDRIKFSGKQIDTIRIKTAKLKSSLQKCGTKSAKRKLKKIGKKQCRFQKDYNHIISKQIVSAAKGTQRAVALEDISGIRARQTVRKTDRGRFGNWDSDNSIALSNIRQNCPAFP